MKGNNILLILSLLGSITGGYGQTKPLIPDKQTIPDQRTTQNRQIINGEYKFSLSYPADVLLTEVGDTVLEFRGTADKYGEDAIFFLKTITRVRTSPLEKLESYMQQTENIESINTEFIDSMKIGFPDITSTGKSFVYFNERPTIQGSYTFTKDKIPMKGRFMIVLVKEQASIYSFSWTSKATGYESWNEASEQSVKSLKIRPSNGNLDRGIAAQTKITGR